jgi:CheY-like chemotaxis protein
MRECRLVEVAPDRLREVLQRLERGFYDSTEVRDRVARGAMADLGTSGVTILLVDDEAKVRMALRRALQHFGYRVVEAVDGDEGLEIIANLGDEIRLVVVDHHMPRLSGAEVLREVRRQSRKLPVILMSGLPLAVASDGSVVPDAFLKKPFELDELVRTAGRLLAGREAAARA